MSYLDKQEKNLGGGRGQCKALRWECVFSTSSRGGSRGRWDQSEDGVCECAFGQALISCCSKRGLTLHSLGSQLLVVTPTSHRV